MKKPHEELLKECQVARACYEGVRCDFNVAAQALRDGAIQNISDQFDDLSAALPAGVYIEVLTVTKEYIENRLAVITNQREEERK